MGKAAIKLISDYPNRYLADRSPVWQHMKRWIIGGVLLAAAATTYRHRDAIRDWIDEQIQNDIQRARVASRKEAERQRLIRDYGPDDAAAIMEGRIPARETPKPDAA